jgi:hypothetical protein
VFDALRLDRAQCFVQKCAAEIAVISLAGQLPLTASGLIMLPALPMAVAGLLLDPRIVTGSPAWLKPAKFALSILIYVFG